MGDASGKSKSPARPRERPTRRPDQFGEDRTSLFGGLSNAERRRIQVRTRASILALATDGRWLGGRPNYGYPVLHTRLPHPHPAQAAAGAPPRTLEPGTPNA